MGCTCTFWSRLRIVISISTTAFALSGAIGHELAAGAFQHVHMQVVDGTECAALDQHGLLVENLRCLHDLAVGREHHRLRETLLDQLQAHQAVIDLGESRARELDHVHFDAALRQVVEQRSDEVMRRILMLDQRAVDEVDADDAERFLLAHIFFVQANGRGSTPATARRGARTGT